MLEIRFAHAVVRCAARNEPNPRFIEPEGRRTPPLFGSTLIRSTHMNALKFILTPSVLFYLEQVRMTRSPRLHFDHSFALYYIIYAYKLIIIG